MTDTDSQPEGAHQPQREQAPDGPSRTEPIEPVLSVDKPVREEGHARSDEQTEAWSPQAPVPQTIAAIPAYNEELTIGSVVHQASAHVDQVVVVDDGSTDRTAEIARQAGARVLRHQENQGKAQAIRTLFGWALDQGVEELVLLDGDGQHDPSQIPQLLTPVTEGEADVSLGFRFGENTEMPFYRRIGKRVLDYATALGADGEVTDSQCGFRAFNRRALEKIELREDGFAVESEMVISARENDLALAEVPITCRYEGVENASTEDPVSHGMGVLDRTIRLITERRPLLYMGLPAAFIVLAGVGLGTWVVWTLKMTGQFAVGTAMLTSMMVLGGTFLGLTAVLLHVIPDTLEKHLGKEALIQVEEQRPSTNGHPNGHANGHPQAADDDHTNGHANGKSQGHAKTKRAKGGPQAHEANGLGKDTKGVPDDGSRMPKPRPPEEIPDWTKPTDQEIPSDVDP